MGVHTVNGAVVRFLDMVCHCHSWVVRVSI